MGRAIVNINITDGGTGGLVGTSDATAGIIMTGVSTAGLALNTAKLIFSTSDAIALGIDEDYDTSNTVKAFQNIKEFYAEAGEGKALWIMLVADTETLESMSDKDGSNPRVNQLIDASGGRIRMIGIQRSPASGYTPTVTNGLDEDVYEAMPKLNATLNQFRGEYMPCIGIVDGFAYDGDATALTDLTAASYPLVSVVLSNTDKESASNPFLSTAVGLTLGRLAKISVSTSIGKVKDGALNTNEAYAGSDSFDVISNGVIDTIVDKGFIVIRRFPTKTGPYFDGDPTATANTSDYNTISRNRTVNKAVEIAAEVFVNELNDSVQTKQDGTLPFGVAAYYEDLIGNQLDTLMVMKGDISSFTVFCDPSQNVVVTDKLIVQVSLVPKGVNREIDIELGYQISQ